MSQYPEKHLEFIQGMKAAGRLAAKTLKLAGQLVKEGVTTNAINDAVHEYTLKNKALPAPLGYKGFPKSLCTSVNECICHGVPDNQALKNGDIINIDVTSILDGYFGDTSATFYVGEVSDQAKALTEAAYHAMHKGIAQVIGGGRVGDIGFAVQKYVTRRGYTPVESIGGHGIGRVFHTEPFVPSVGKKGKGFKLQPWTCITVEPMLNMTSSPIQEFAIPDSEIFYYKAEDSCLSAQFEHTLLITDTGYEIMTLDEEEAVSFK